MDEYTRHLDSLVFGDTKELGSGPKLRQPNSVGMPEFGGAALIVVTENVIGS
jgi:hypothetical protein